MKLPNKKRIYFRLGLQIAALALVLALSLNYFISAPNSAAWLHVENFNRSNFEIGLIKFRFYNDSDTEAVKSLAVHAIAPTRYFNTENDPDLNFDMVAKSHAVTGSNFGTVDMLVDLSMTDTLESPWKFFFLIVPIESTANYQNNYLSRHYRAYVDTALAGRPIETQAEREAAFRAVNELNIAKVQKVRIPKAQSRTLCYLLLWAEYDTINWDPKVNANFVIEQSLPLVLHAHCYQDYIS